ncbi:GrpB family protein [Longimicrobium sp.]|uniref:GrpB family protein n=1 Tax=Longimicrobium sp. TaxID=2029185 RepID=UPI003B3B22A6
MKNVKVVPHDPRWRAAFEVEARHVAAALGENVVAVHHVGSTSIPGIHAKPIIDLLVELNDVGQADARSPAMESLGYQVMGEYGLPGRRYYRKDDPDGIRTHHVHAFQAGSEQVVRHLAFRDYLRAHPADAQAYGELKQKLAREHPQDMNGYMDGKDGFIKEMDRRAAAWRASFSDEHADGV